MPFSLIWAEAKKIQLFDSLPSLSNKHLTPFPEQSHLLYLYSTIHAQPYNDLPFKGINIFAFIQIILFSFDFLRLQFVLENLG